METLIMIGQLMLGLSLLVFVHELGHFLAAKAFGMRVPKFYIFFDAWGKKLWSKQIGETEYGIGWLPMGGYVQISGMIDETQDKSALMGEPQPWEFRAKPAWQRFIVMIAGVVMNVITGIIIFTMFLATLEKEYLPMSEVNKDGIYAYDAAKNIGLQNGDKITAINGKPFERFKELISTKVFFGSDLTVERNGQTIHLKTPNNFYEQIKNPFVGTMYEKVTVEALMSGSFAEQAGLQKGDRIVRIDSTVIDRFVQIGEVLKNFKGGQVLVGIDRNGQNLTLTSKVDTSGKIGFVPAIDLPYTYKPYTWGSAFHYSFKDGYDLVASQIIAFKLMFTGRLSVRDNLASPIAIARIYGGQWDWKRFWRITGLLSFVLAFMNILPIPALDGGHILFIAIETITRRKISDAILEKAQIFGMILLLCLMVFAFGNDIYKWFYNKF
ncbi:RIP metalloprotease RseP [Sphingobacteriales bacterium UPWRP_1]|nr:RIP metalloprotease RseP [Sphingobacteriales bacterium TSM_CSS]PSJ74928.1 RIP metalloprotease RseP [Sphingobacteriales bacterium UPWRP_1]